MAIIIFMIFLLFFYHRKRLKEKPDLEVPQQPTTESKPTIKPQPEVQEQAKDSSVPTIDHSISQIPFSIEVPTLSSSTAPSQVPETLQILQAAQRPKLPATGLTDTKNE